MNKKFVISRVFFYFEQRAAYEMRISDWSSDVCSSDLRIARPSRLARSVSVRGSLPPFSSSRVRPAPRTRRVQLEVAKFEPDDQPVAEHVICLVAEIGPALRGDPDAVDIDDIQRIISDPRSIGNVERIILSPQESVRAEIKFLCAAMGGDAFGHDGPEPAPRFAILRSEEHTSELQSLMRISYAVFCLKKK